MKKLLIPAFLCFCLAVSTTYVMADGVIRKFIKPDWTDFVTAGLAATAVGFESGDANKAAWAFATTGWKPASMYDSLSRMYKSFFDSDQNEIEPVTVSIWKYKVDKLYNALIANMSGQEKKMLVHDQNEFRKMLYSFTHVHSQAKEENKPDMYIANLKERYEKLEKKRKELGLPADITIKKQSIEFDDSPKNFGECGDIVVNLPISDKQNIMVACMDNGKFVAYYSESPLCRRAVNYICGRLGKRKDTPQEIREMGIDSDEIFTIDDCQGG